MEALRQDDPRRIGPYALLLRLRETASAVQYLAHGPDGTTAVVAVARPELAGLPAFRRRFQTEAQTAERLAGGWVQTPLASRTDGPDLWTATDYVPALNLAEAVALAGPLPEPTVRVLGAALAETLSRVHATGAVLHGLAADTVLLAADGPRLTAFGALGAAAAAEAGPGGQLSVRLGYLTPEQLAGREPGPASDLFVLGLLLAYAATGATPWAAGPQADAADRIAHAEPELAAVPAELRTLIARCLAKSPADRPAPGTLAAELALEGAAALARPGWLPGDLVAALADQAARASAGAQSLVPLAAPSPHRGSAPDPGPQTPDGLKEPTAPAARHAHGATAPEAADQARPALIGPPANGDNAATAGENQAHPALVEPPTSGDHPVPAEGNQARPALIEPPTNRAHPVPAEGNQARPAIEDTPAGRPGGWGPAPSYGKGRVGESPAGPTGAADVDGGLTRRLVTRRGADDPTEDLSGVTRPLVTRRAAGLPAEGPPPGQAAGQPVGEPVGEAQSVGGAGALVPAPPPLSHPAAALTLPPATVGPTGPTGPTRPAQPPRPAPIPPTGPSPHRVGERLSRRGLFAGIAAGAAGLLVGGGGVLALSGGDDEAPPPRTDDAKPAARRKPLPGVAPDPLWHYQHPVALAADGPPARLWRDQVLLIPGEELTTALDARTGRRLWEQKAAGTTYGPEAADSTHCFVVTSTDFLWLSAKDGLVRHRAAYAPLLTKGRKDTRATLGGRVAADGPVVWFAGRVETLGGKKDKVTRTRTYLFAYDMAARKELWRTEMPNGRPGPVPRYEAVGIRPGSLLVRQDTGSLTADQKKKAKGKSAFILIDRRTGKTLWRKFFPGVRPDAGVTDDPSGRLYAAVGGKLQAYDTRSGKKLWQFQDASGPAGDAPFGFGPGVVRDKTLYVPSGHNEVYALDTASGAQQWKRATEYPGGSTPRVSLSGSGRTVFALDATQATAIGARDGQRLWKFQDSGVTAPGAEDEDEAVGASYRALTSGSRAVLWRGRNFYALPLG
ncbi:PQQ-binding-like beta-propeller repeat protein [Streptomyces flavidovirens]|uniref:outer membrane protein assembly factor BamB family protein n=1 Tax=Streptomyces flavidovirens TaxID=67298 RepID=UPI00339FDBF6